MRKVSENTLKYSILLFWAFAAILPFYWTFIRGISGWGRGGIQTGPITWWPSNPRWQNFIYAWNYMQYPPLWRALLNSTIVAVPRTLLVLFASSLTAYALAMYKFRGGRAIFWIVISTMMIPGFISLIPSYILMKWFGWINTYWALIIPGFASAYNSLVLPGVVSAYSVFLMRQYILTIPDDVIDAARLYGCSEFGLFWRIVLPLCKPVLAVVGLLNFVWSWNDYLWPLIVISDRDMFTVQLALSWASPSGPVGAALITLATLPLIIFTLITQKFLMKGLAGLGYPGR